MAPPISMRMVSPQRLFVHSFADTHTLTHKRTHAIRKHINMVILQQIPQTHAYVTFSKGNIDHFRISFSFNFGGQHFNTVKCFMIRQFFGCILTELKMNRFYILSEYTK